MAAPYNKEVTSRVSSDAAETVAREFYKALSSTAQRAYLTTYFVAQVDMGSGHKLPDILYNGTKYGSPGSFQEFIQALPRCNYDLQSLNASIINPALAIEGFNEQDIKKGKAAVLLVTTSGRVSSDEDERIFSDSFVVMPNPEANRNGRRDRGKREWLIAVYNSRHVGEEGDNVPHA